MTKYSFFNPDTGQTIFVTGPNTLTRDVAQRLFDQQRASGALINLKPGETITAASQAADGLKTAEPQALAELQTSISQGTGFQFPALTKALTSTPITNGITVAGYANQPSATTTIRRLTTPEVTGVLAQVGNLTRQKTSEATNLGVGKYALTVSQLERAGYVKPGTASTYLSQHQNSTLGVLNSTSVWTGKDGIQNLNNLLTNPSVQDSIQQTLMAQGLDQLVEIGISVDLYTAKEQAGVALLAAIDVPLAVDFIAGKITQPIPTAGPLPDDQPNNWQYPQRIVRDASFATDFAATRINNSLKRETDARGYVNTTNRESIDAAATRIVGNDKIAPVSYGGDPVDAVLVDEFNMLADQLVTITTKVNAVLAQTTTLATAAVKEAQLKAYKLQLQQFVKTADTSTSRINTRLLGTGSMTITENTGLQGKFEQLVRKAEASAPVSPQFLLSLDSKLAEINTLISEINKALQFIARVLGKNTVRDTVAGTGIV